MLSFFVGGGVGNVDIRAHEEAVKATIDISARTADLGRRKFLPREIIIRNYTSGATKVNRLLASGCFSNHEIPLFASPKRS